MSALLDKLDIETSKMSSSFLEKHHQLQNYKDHMEQALCFYITANQY